MARTYKVYVDMSSRNIYDSTGEELTPDSAPYLSYKEKIQLQIQYLNSPPVQPIVDGNLDKYTGFAALTIASSAVVDNNRNHYDEGALNAGYSGVVTSIAVKTLEAVPRLKSGELLLINSAGQYETVAFTNYTVADSVYTFTVSDTLTYTYSANDVVRVKETPIIKSENSDIDATDKATGLFLVNLNGKTQTFEELVEGSESISSCYFEQQIFESTDVDSPICVIQFPFRCFGIIDDGGVVPPASASDFYTKVQVDALLLVAKEYQYSVDGSTLWHDTQTSADLYWRERYPDGEWGDAIAMVVGPAGEDAPETQIQYSVDGSTSWHSTFTAGDLYQRVSVDGGSTWSDAMEFVGADGADGDKGWSPVFAVVSDGARRVLQVADWTGGEGTKPATGSYVGVSGLVELIADAVDIRGGTGATGSDGADAPEVQYQYSDDNATWHSPWVSGDVYMRISTDGGSTWGTGMLFTSSGVNTDVEFDNGDLTAGVLTVTGTRSIVAIVDNSGKVIFPDEITYGATDTTVDLTSFGTLTGTWKILFSQGKDGKDGTDGTNGTNGTNGTDGVSFVWKGAYSDATTYAANDAVEYNGSSYMSLQGSNLDKEPGVDTDYWELMAQKGTDGADGADGDMLNPMTTAGDVIYGGASGTPARLAAGTAGQVLKMNSGATAPEWGDAVSAGGSDGATISLTDDRTMAAAEVGKHFDYTSSTAATKTLTLATPPVNNSAPVWIKNSSAYNITVSGHINGTASSSFTLYPDCTIKLISEGATWRIVMERWEPNTNTTSHAFSSLAGNTDRTYMLKSIIVPGNSQTGRVNIYANADTTSSNYQSQYFEGVDTSTSAGRETGAGFAIGYVDASPAVTLCVSTTTIEAKSGKNRTSITNMMRSTSSITQQTGMNATVWLNSSNEITTLTVSFGTNGFGVGSCIELWKLAQ